jgi:pimeloyl-ACP methyl ester carboxylesterase
MQNNFIKILLISVVLCMQMLSLDAYAQRSRTFLVSKTKISDQINGQIDWPDGSLEKWNGPVIVLISSGNPYDRDGWGVRTLETVWFDRSPLKTFSDALVKKGMAVVRFDNPGVSPPQSKCRQTIINEGLSDRIIKERCLDVKVLENLTVERYVNSIEAVISHAQTLTKAAKHRLVLFGFSEGLWHAVTIAERHRFIPRAVLSIGGAVEQPKTLSLWQGTQRIVDTIPQFDTNGDGIVTNEEIQDGYKKGVGRFATKVESWLSQKGQWVTDDMPDLLKNFENQYAQMVEEISHNPQEQKRLHWAKQENGVMVPDITNSFWRLHVLGDLSAIDVLSKKKIPGFFMWGEHDTQVRVAHQKKLVQEAKESGALFEEMSFPTRFHLLSTERDLDWFEPEFSLRVAELVHVFLNKIFEKNR